MGLMEPRAVKVALLLSVILAGIVLGACGTDGGDAAPPDTTTSITSTTSTTTSSEIKVFFTPEGAAQEDCAAVEPVNRTADGDALLEAAMTELLKGPTAEEAAAGLTSWFSADTAGMLNSVVIDDRTARIDFADFSTLIPNASTSCGSAMLLAQLDATAAQFDPVDETIYSFDGDVASFYEWLQFAPPD